MFLVVLFARALATVARAGSTIYISSGTNHHLHHYISIFSCCVLIINLDLVMYNITREREKEKKLNVERERARDRAKDANLYIVAGKNLYVVPKYTYIIFPHFFSLFTRFRFPPSSFVHVYIEREIDT